LNLKEKPFVSIIILNYNAGNLLLECVDSILKTVYKNFEIIIVDNKSSDNSHLKCKQKFPDIKMIANLENFGYCEGNNIGIRNAVGELVVILNPDTVVIPGWLDELIKAYYQKGDGFYQPKILTLEDPSIIQSTGNMIQLFGFGFTRDRGIKNNCQRNLVEEIGFPSGACFLVPKKILEKLNLFDSFLFLYMDDLDLGWRGTQIGIKSYYVPTSSICHVEGSNLRWSSKKFFWLERNRKYCLLTHLSRKTFFLMLPSLMLVDFLVFLFCLRKGFPSAKIKAEWDVLKNFSKILKKYNEIESKKLIPDKTIIKDFTDSIFLPQNLTTTQNDGIFLRYFSKLSRLTKWWISKFM
jgi:hypothetical protein